MDNQLSTIGLFGAAPDTGNQGVSALCYGTLEALYEGDADTVYVFDHGTGVRAFPEASAPNGLKLFRSGATTGKRIWRAEHYRRIELGLAGRPFATPVSNAIKSLDAVLDLSGGDSFSDLYGEARFAHVMRPKRLAMRQSLPLVLLPQTYGPFETSVCREAAREALQYAAISWARDTQSFARLKVLLGDDFDPIRHRLGVDMALGLPRVEPKLANSPVWFDWIKQAAQGKPVIGINISGLIYNDPTAARERFALRVRYEEAILALVARLVNEQQVRVLLIPHVLTDPAQAESDISACRDLATRLPERLRKHVAVVEECKDARELKWVISKLDWFCGTRLHATIAGLSSGVPTATLAYSMKAQGIFDDFASGDHCADMRFLNSVTAVNQVLKSYLNRDAHKSILQHARYIMLQRWVQQVNDLNGYLASPTFQQVA